MTNNNYENTVPLSLQDASNQPKKEGWERDLLEKLAFASLREQRARRRWGVFFKLVTLVIVGFVIWTAFDFSGADMKTTGSHTALVEIDGVIEAGGAGAADKIIPALDRAYADDGSVGVIMRINSPGGSPVQAGMINDEITRLRKAYPKKPLYVVVDEMCASGGYYIAAAADRIYVNKASIVGSIGVLMEKVGIERRLLTAGENKGFLDPFSPQTAKHKEYAQTMLNEIHQQFIDVVRKGRGKRLKETPDMFSGLYWSGAKAVELGLADGFGTTEMVAREELKSEDIIDYTQHEGLPERVLKKFGASVGAGAIQSIWSGVLPNLR